MPSAAEILVHSVPARGLAAVPARVVPGGAGAVFSRYLDQVYAAARAGKIEVDGQNVFLYRDGADGMLDIEFGVGVRAPFPPAGAVRYVELPAGRAATATHVGDYGGLGAVHAAIVAWCRAHGHALAGVRWEVYGHWEEGVPPRTEVSYLLAD